MKLVKTQGLLGLLGATSLGVLVSHSALYSWLLGVSLGMLGPLFLAWRMRPAFDGWSAQSWLVRLYGSVAIKWLLVAAVLSLGYSLGIHNMPWLGLGYGAMVLIQWWVYGCDIK